MKKNATNSKFYTKSDALLISMAVRSDHGFGMYDKEEQDKIIKQMNQLYDSYISGKSDKKISDELGIYIVTVSQVREEVDGNGFFKPAQEDNFFYHKFRKK